MTPPTRLIDAVKSDYPAILRLNADAVPHVNLISEATLCDLHAASCYFRQVVVGDVVAGFLLALPEGARYDSLNYRWFSARYPTFVYIDRVVVGQDFQRQGIGRLLYGDLEAMARRRAPLLSCEVNLRPSNPGSMAFHEAFGFEEVGQQDTEGGEKRVRLMVKSLQG